MSLRLYRDTHYAISEDGDIINNTTGRRLKPTITSNGYFQFTIYQPYKRQINVHAAVMEVYVGPRQDGFEINHKNGDKSDNRLINLEYITSSENKLHAYELGLVKKGEEKTGSKLTEKDVEKIKLRFVSGDRTAKIAEDFGVNSGTISEIRAGRSWKYIRPDLSWHKLERQVLTRKLCAEDIPVIRKMFTLNYSNEDIAKVYGVARATIFQIRCGNTWKNY